MNESTGLDGLIRAIKQNPNCKDIDIEMLTNDAQKIAATAKETSFEIPNVEVLVGQYARSAYSEATAWNIAEATCSTLKTLHENKQDVYTATTLIDAYAQQVDTEESSWTLAEATIKTLDYMAKECVDVTQMTLRIAGARSEARKARAETYDQKRRYTKSYHRGLGKYVRLAASWLGQTFEGDLSVRQITDIVLKPKEQNL